MTKMETKKKKSQIYKNLWKKKHNVTFTLFERSESNEKKIHTRKL